MKKKYLLAFLCSILFLGITNVSAITFNSTDKNIAGTEEDEVIYIIGTHLFSEKTPYLSTQKIMLASQTIKLPENIKEEEALDYMVIYTRDLEGNWIDALDGQSANIPSTFDIQHTDLKAFDSIVVNSLEELESALDEEGYKTIILGSDIDAGNASIVVDRKVTIDGNEKKLTFGELAESTSGLVVSADEVVVKNLTVELTKPASQKEEKEWQGNYAIQVYNAKGVVLDNIAGTKADAALLVNGSAVELKGVTNVSGNEYGGIEVSRGKDLTENGSLKVTGTITMTDEASNRPVIWVEKEQGSVDIEGYVSTTDMNDKDQTYYYSDEKYITKAKVAAKSDLASALSNKYIEEIELTGDVEGITEMLTVNHSLTINGNGHTIKAGNSSIFHITGDISDEIPTATLTLNNVKVVNEKAVAVRVGTHHPVDAKTTNLKVIIDKDSYIESNMIGVLVLEKNATVDLYGEIKANNAGIQGNGTNSGGYYDGETIVNVYEGAKITALNGMALYIPQTGIVNIKGGDLKGKTAIAIKSGELNVSGGNLEATGEYKTPIRNDNGGSATGDVIFVELNESYIGGQINDNIKINITGGNFKAADGNALRVSNTSGTTATYKVNGTNLVSATLDNSTMYDFNEIAVRVTTESELEAALADIDVSEIMLLSDITGISKTLSANHKIVIDGREHKLQFNEIAKVNGVASGLVISADNSEVKNLTIEMTEKAEWQGNYALQVFNAKGVVLENYTGTKADAALLVNGSAVELKGVTNVSGNEFGGIEVSRGKDLTENGSLKVTGTITMADEAYKVPAVWVVKEQGSVVGGSFTTNETIKADQIQYYLSSANANE